MPPPPTHHTTFVIAPPEGDHGLKGASTFYIPAYHRPPRIREADLHFQKHKSL